MKIFPEWHGEHSRSIRTLENKWKHGEIRRRFWNTPKDISISLMEHCICAVLFGDSFVLYQGFSIIFPYGPQRAEDSLMIDVWGPNDHHFPMYFYTYWSWQRAKQVWSAGRIWPAGRHLRRPVLYLEHCWRHSYCADRIVLIEDYWLISRSLEWSRLRIF